MPPSEASAPGSIGKNRPWSRRCSLSALRVMPGSITQSRSSACTASTRFMSRKSIEMPPCGALTWPSSDEPVPNGITGTPWPAQMRTISCTSAVLCGNTTASGGWFAIQVSVLPCCSRTACEVTRRLPNFCVSTRIAASIAAGVAARRGGFDERHHAATLEHDPEKWKPVFGRDHAQHNKQNGGAAKARRPDVARRL